MESRRRRQDRGVVTRAALVDAALDCLIEKGYAATTTIEVARRAGVSRGAQLHHFPSKAELLTAAVDHLYRRRMREFRAAFDGVAAGADRLDQAIDLLWSMFAGPTFVAWAELWMAARTDPALRTAVVEMNRRCGEESQAIFDELFRPEDGIDPELYAGAREFAYVVMDGLALNRLVPHDQQTDAKAVLDTLKTIARMFSSNTTPLETT